MLHQRHLVLVGASSCEQPYLLTTGQSAAGCEGDNDPAVNSFLLDYDNQSQCDFESGVIDEEILSHPDPYVRTLINRGSEDTPYLGFDNANDAYEPCSSQPRPFTIHDNCSDLDIRNLAQVRMPHPSQEFCTHPAHKYYAAARPFGTSNEQGEKVTVRSRLNLDVWDGIKTGHSDDPIVLSGIRHGFSLQYTGDPLSELPIEMHASGEKFQKHILDYIDDEIGYGAIACPFQKTPFREWCRTSPIMTRPKSDSQKRRVIVDLSYPTHASVNQAVYKNNYYGAYIGHKLPRVKDIVSEITNRDFNVALATLDIRRAYRNFPGCPFDYPLNVIKCQGRYYIDLAMPFGARSSSTYMQKISEYIIRALRCRDIPVDIYLDDVIFYLHPEQDPASRLREAIALFKALGLPLAEEKIQPPSNCVKYLGVWLDVGERRITIPKEKIDNFL